MDFIRVPRSAARGDQASLSEQLECEVIRSDNKATAIKFNIEPVEKLAAIVRDTRFDAQRTDACAAGYVSAERDAGRSQ